MFASFAPVRFHAAGGKGGPKKGKPTPGGAKKQAMKRPGKSARAKKGKK